MGVGMGMNANGSYLSQAAQNNQEQIKQQAENKINKLHKEMRILGHVQFAGQKIPENSVPTAELPNL